VVRGSDVVDMFSTKVRMVWSLTRLGPLPVGVRATPTPQSVTAPTSWIRKVESRIVTHTLTADQAERYQAWFDNTRRLRELVNDLEALSVQVINDAE
jgi:hypothetical protein